MTGTISSSAWCTAEVTPLLPVTVSVNGTRRLFVFALLTKVKRRSEEQAPVHGAAGASKLGGRENSVDHAGSLLCIEYQQFTPDGHVAVEKDDPP